MLTHRGNDENSRKIGKGLWKLWLLRKAPFLFHIRLEQRLRIRNNAVNFIKQNKTKKIFVKPSLRYTSDSQSHFKMDEHIALFFRPFLQRVTG